MDLHYKQEVSVGLLVLTGIGLFLASTTWLRGGSLLSKSKGDVSVLFPDAGTLKRGSAVRVSGVNLGAVERIEYQGVGKVLVVLKLQSVVAPRIDASARLATVGLVGEPVVTFNPGLSAEPLPSGRVIQGVIDQGLSELGSQIGDQAKIALTGFNEIANKKLADNLNSTLQVMQRFMAAYADPKRGPAGELTATLQQLRQLSARLDTAVGRADLASTLRKSDTLVSNLSGTTAGFATTAARLDSLLQKVNRGDGSLGKLVTDTLLYDDLRKLVGSLKELADDLRKHPGKITIQVKAF